MFHAMRNFFCILRVHNDFISRINLVIYKLIIKNKEKSFIEKSAEFIIVINKNNFFT